MIRSLCLQKRIVEGGGGGGGVARRVAAMTNNNNAFATAAAAACARPASTFSTVGNPTMLLFRHNHCHLQQQQLFCSKRLVSTLSRRNNDNNGNNIRMVSSRFAHYYLKTTTTTTNYNNNNNNLKLLCLRALSTKNTKEGSSSSNTNNNNNDNDNDDDTKEIVLTPGQQVVAVSRLGMWLGIFAFACACAYYIGKELIPTKLSPNSIFNKASELVKHDPQVLRQYGDKLKTYGKDHGGHREGRRNFVEYSQYVSPDDQSNRTRIRFNLQGQFAQAFVFAEMSSNYDDFVYVLVQDKQTGRVITVKDNRAAITAQRLSGGNAETNQAMQQLLGGGGGGSKK